MIEKKEIEEIIRKLKPVLKNNFNIERIGYFGSFARNEQNEQSDIDILVKMSKPLGWKFFDLKDLLENELNLEVDLVTENALKEQLKVSILKSVKYL